MPTMHEMVRAYRGKKYKPNGQRERERRVRHIAAGSLKAANGLWVISKPRHAGRKRLAPTLG